MTTPVQENKPEDVRQDTSEINLVKQRQFYERKLAEERAAREEMEKRMQELQQKTEQLASSDEDDDPEPYVDHKRLAKKLAKFEEQTAKKTRSELDQTKEQVKEEIRNELWLENHPDFEETLQHAQKLLDHDPALTNSILLMPDNFARKQLVYNSIKALGLAKPAKKDSGIQDQIDSKQRGGFYQPSGIGTAPYNQAPGDFSQQGQKSAYEYIQSLKARIGLNG